MGRVCVDMRTPSLLEGFLSRFELLSPTRGRIENRVGHWRPRTPPEATRPLNERRRVSEFALDTKTGLQDVSADIDAQSAHIASHLAYIASHLSCILHTLRMSLA